MIAFFIENNINIFYFIFILTLHCQHILAKGSKSVALLLPLQTRKNLKVQKKQKC